MAARVAHMGDGVLLELDTGSGAVLATVPDLPSVTGVIVVPELRRVFASAAGAGQVVTIDEDTAAVLARARAGRFPDGLAYAPLTGQVWVSDESGGAEIVLDAGTGRMVARVPLGGEAGNVRYDRAGDRVLVDVQSRDEVAVIDPHRRAVVGRVPVPGCEHDHGLPQVTALRSRARHQSDEGREALSSEGCGLQVPLPALWPDLRVLIHRPWFPRVRACVDSAPRPQRHRSKRPSSLSTARNGPVSMPGRPAFGSGGVHLTRRIRM